jgi:tryptophan-rich sensory protein
MRQIIVLVCIVPALIIANVGGITTADVANSFDSTNFFFPANFVFPIIWTTIYSLVAFFAVWQALPAQRDNPRAVRTGPVVAINMILNAAWVLVFGQQMWLLSEIIIIAILVTCGLSYLYMRTGKVGGVSRGEKIAWAGMAIYFGWVTVATVANTSLLLVTMDMTNLFGIAPSTWGVIMLVVAAVVGLGVSFTLHEPAYLGVFLFAYLGVVYKQMNGGASDVAITAAIGAALFAVILIARYLPPLKMISIPRVGNLGAA